VEWLPLVGWRPRIAERRTQCYFEVLRTLAAAVYSAIDLLTHFSITSAIWSEFFSSIIMWPLP
jgi:hypothetical protein